MLTFPSVCHHHHRIIICLGKLTCIWICISVNKSVSECAFVVGGSTKEEGTPKFANLHGFICVHKYVWHSGPHYIIIGVRMRGWCRFSWRPGWSCRVGGMWSSRIRPHSAANYFVKWRPIGIHLSCPQSRVVVVGGGWTVEVAFAVHSTVVSSSCQHTESVLLQPLLILNRNPPINNNATLAPACRASPQSTHTPDPTSISTAPNLRSAPFVVSLSVCLAVPVLCCTVIHSSWWAWF